MVFVEKIPVNLIKALGASGSFVIRGLHQQVAYIGHADRVFALQGEAVALTPISLALDCRIDFRDGLAADTPVTMADGILTLGGLVIDTRKARPVDLSLNRAPEPERVRDRIPEWRNLVRTVMVDTLAERTISRAGYPRNGSRQNRDIASVPEPLGVGDLMLGLRGRQPLPRPARAHEGVDVRGAFIRHLNRFLEHAATLDAAGPTGRGSAAEGLAQDIVRLVGLGPGLTPSGDDFLIGLLSVLGFLHGGAPTGSGSRHAGGISGDDEGDGNDGGISGDGSGDGDDGDDGGFPAGAFLHQLRLAIRPKLAATAMISAAFLREAAEGRFNEHLCGHFDSVAHADWDMARRQLAAVAGAGHSSGTDTLGGMLLGFALVDEGSRARQESQWAADPAIGAKRGDRPQETAFHHSFQRKSNQETIATGACAQTRKTDCIGLKE